MSITPSGTVTAIRNSGLVTYNAFSGSLWLYLVDRSTRLVFFSNEGASNNLDRYTIETDGKFSVRSTGVATLGTTVAPLNTWFNVGFKRSGANQTIYYNGVEEVTHALGVTFTNYWNKVGAEYGGAHPSFSYAALKLWNADLSAAQFEAEMYGYEAVETTGLNTITRFLTSTDLANEVGGGVGWTVDSINGGSFTTNTDPPAFLASGGGSGMAALRRKRYSFGAN